MSKLRIFGLSLLTLAMVAFADCRGNKNGDEASQSDTLSYPSDDLNLVSEQTPEIVANDNVAEEPVQMEDQNGNLTTAPAEVINQKDAFYIVAGSFTLYSNAQKLNNKLKAKGFDSKILEQNGQYNRVTVKEFKTAEEARAALPALRSQIDQQLWLLTR
ncbi:MAG: SPOR domain-containing protein [Bacteroidales bacterium]|nr:SPOR domain-containing protein [Bacteroidales bacterium]